MKSLAELQAIRDKMKNTIRINKQFIYYSKIIDYIVYDIKPDVELSPKDQILCKLLKKNLHMHGDLEDVKTYLQKWIWSIRKTNI